MDTLLGFLNRASATLLGTLLVLLKYLVIQLVTTVLIALASLGLFIGLPFFLGVDMYRENFNPILVLLITLGAFSATVIIPFMTLAAVAFFFVTDGFKLLIQSVSTGLTKGWQGMKIQLNEDLEHYSTAAASGLAFFDLLFNDTEQNAGRDENSEQRFSDDAFNQLNQPQPNIKKELKIPDLAAVNALIAQHKGTEQSKKLALVVSQFEALHNKLNKIQTRLSEGKSLADENELIPAMEVTEPILLVKEYNHKDKWHVVPGSTKMTDKDGIKQWFQQRAIHPLFGDSIKKPTDYNNMPCHYRWYHFRVDCQELIELTEEIQRLSQIMQGAPINSPPVNHAMSDALSMTLLYKSTDKKREQTSPDPYQERPSPPSLG